MHDDRVVATSIDDPSGGRPDIWTIRLDTGTAERVFRSPTWDVVPRWSRDGRQLLFRASEGVRIADVGSGSPPATVLETIPGLERVDDWSRDDRHVLVSVVTAERRFDVLRLDLQAGATPVPLIATPATESFARFSPDATHVAYVSDVLGPPEVFVQKFPAMGPARRVSLSGGTLPKWSADGLHLYFFSPDGWIMDAAISTGRGEITVGTAARAARGSGLDFAPAADGRFLLLEQEFGRPLAVVNWQSLLPQP
jgi:Tol biopolymer transport system component